jgi:hypothetical protein
MPDEAKVMTKALLSDIRQCIEKIYSGEVPTAGQYADQIAGMRPLPKRVEKPREIPKIPYEMYRNILRATS